ncbi:MAG: M1 family metallopeptidase [Gemmatimonadales bacterium]
MFTFLAVSIGAASTVAWSPSQDSTRYWQQEVHYEIHARLDEGPGTLTGRERIVYVNRSRDTLTEFFLHLYLNAFRPGSRWSDRDSVEGRRRFNDLQDPDYAYDRITGSTIDGTVVAADFPYAPDSTIAHFGLLAPLGPGDSMVVEVAWQARPSTVPRRQGRRGRRFDFAQWYPRVVAYDRDGWEDHPLYPAGEFYGEFGTYDVTLDLAEDQVIGATGVPIEGDPGWERARADPATTVDYQRDWYSSSGGPVTDGKRGCAAVHLSAGRKCVRFYAADVHHFAMSLNPDYVYEQGRYKAVIVRVLYTPEDRKTWGGGIAVGRTAEALRWLDEIFGPFPWPQITNVHRIEGGGTEFPMMVMNGGVSLGLILHEVGHNYLMGILANNEWKEGYLDEGFTSFQTTWYFEEHAENYDGYHRVEGRILAMDLDGWSQPVSTISENFRDFNTYNAMIYSKGELFYHQLRYIVGPENMRCILREYYRRWKLKHVDERSFRDVAEEVSGMDLGWFFSQWLHGTPMYDYAIGKVKRERRPDGTWDTAVEVERKGDGWMPVEIGEGRWKNGTQPLYGRASGLKKKEVVTFHTQNKPGRLLLDSRIVSHDWNFTNNRERHFLDVLDVFGGRWRLDNYVQDVSLRDRAVHSIAPTVWYNDAAELTVGFRVRSNYLGRYNRTTAYYTRGTTGDDPTTRDAVQLFDSYFKFENPVFLRKPNTSQSFEYFSMEGRLGMSLGWESEHRKTASSENRLHQGWKLRWINVDKKEFLDPALWEDGGTVELSRFVEWDLPSGPTDWNVRLDYGGGLVYADDDARLGGSDVEAFGRTTGSVWVKRASENGRWHFGARFFAGGYLAKSDPLHQRAIPVAGADPYQTILNPFVRSKGAPFVRNDVFYQSPGNGNLRGYGLGRSGRWATAVNVQLDRDLYVARSGLLRAFALRGFFDGGVVDSLAVPSGGNGAATALYDAGAGVRFHLKIGDLDFPLRVEFPLLVSRPDFADNTNQGVDRLEFRWLVSLAPTF